MRTRVLERAVHAPSLALRFADALTGSPVADGLQVSIHPLRRPDLRHDGLANGSSIWVFHDLPGRRARELGGDDAGGVPEFVVEVEDRERRFLPCSIEVEPTGGFWQFVCPGPGSDANSAAWAGDVPLFSAPSRRPSPPVAEVRGELRQAGADAPAAFAVLELDAGGQLAVGVADARGRFGLFFPYPAVYTAASSTDPSDLSAGPALADLEWTLAVEARFTRRAAVDFPDLVETLTQAPVRAWADEKRTVPLDAVRLRYGRPTELKTVWLES